MSDNETKNLHLSDQAIGAVMMALQRSLLEQSDIVPTLKDMKLKRKLQKILLDKKLMKDVKLTELQLLLIKQHKQVLVFQWTVEHF